MRKLLTAVLALALAAPIAAAASEPPPKAAGKGEGAFVDITNVALPIVEPSGRLVNYVFVQVRVNLIGSADVAKLQQKEPFLRDALVRAAHRTPFTAKADYFHVDEARVKATVLKDAGAILGAKNVTSIEIMSQQTKQRSGVPKPTA